MNDHDFRTAFLAVMGGQATDADRMLIIRELADAFFEASRSHAGANQAFADIRDMADTELMP